MNIVKRITVPTGDILIADGDKGKLELLSLGDYGKSVNVKADFMGLDRNPDPVRHTELLPLTEKWVITVSTQYGCSMKCNFCDVPKVGPGLNATLDDLVNQVKVGMSIHPEVTYTNRLNIHYARMGEPTWNPNVIPSVFRIMEEVGKNFKIHPVVSTMMPKNNKDLIVFIDNWMDLKYFNLNGEAGLQLSINSTDEAERREMFGGCASTLEEIGSLMRVYNSTEFVKGRKITLNFAVAGYTVDPDVLLKYFNPETFLIKLTPIHKTAAATENGVQTGGDYTTYEPYSELEASLKKAGYDVLVFIASIEEDLGRITCGNAILSGTKPEVEHQWCELHE